MQPERFSVEDKSRTQAAARAYVVVAGRYDFSWPEAQLKAADAAATKSKQLTCIFLRMCKVENPK